MWWIKSVKFLIVFLCLGLIFSAPAPLPAAAQTGDVPKVQVQLAWEGLVHEPEWTELQITLENETGDWEGELLLLDTENLITYHRSLSLPARSRKFYRIPLFIEGGWGLEVQLQDADGRRVYQAPLVFNVNPAAPVCGIGDSQGPLAADVSPICATTFLIADLTRLPETPMAWENLDALLINGLDTSELTAPQQTALLAWVANGGHLILSGGAALPQTLAGLPETLRIAAPGALQTFTELDTAIIPAGQVTAPGLNYGPGAAPLPAGDVAHLTAQQPIGQGHVMVIAWDVVQSGSLGWLAESWMTVETLSEETYRSISGQSYFNAQWLFAVPSANTPQLWHWLIFFPLYILLLGPLTWFLVRRLKRPVLTWALLPAWIVLALLLVALGLNGAFGSSFPLIHEIAAIRVPGNGLPARVLQGTAIYAPRTRRLTWRTTGAPRSLYGSYMLDSYSEGDAYPIHVTHQDDAYALTVPKPFGILTWGAEGFYTPPALQSNLRINTAREAPVLTGVLQGEVALRNVTLLMGNGQYALRLTDVLTAGLALNVTQSLTQTYTSYYTNDPCSISGGYYTRYPTYSPLLLSGSKIDLEAIRSLPCRITAVADGVPFPAQDIAGSYVAESCLIYTVPCPIQMPGTLIAVMRGEALPNSGGWVNDEGIVQMLAEPATEIAYTLPEFLNMRTAQTLTLMIEPAWRDTTPFDPATEIAELAFWDWQQEEWITQPLPPAAEPLTLNGAAVQRFFDPLAGVRVQLKGQDDNNSIKITLTVAGTF